MKVTLDVRGPNNKKFWDFTMNYYDLPPAYVMEIGSVAQSYGFYIENLGGQGGTQTPTYSVTFDWEAEGEEVQGLSGEMLKVVKGKSRAQNLLYSQAVGVQDAGIELLQKLQQGAHMEIKSGQRK